MTALVEWRDDPSVVFSVRMRSGVWEVTRDQAFYGDYVRRRDAVTAAQTGAFALQAPGPSPYLEAPAVAGPGASSRPPLGTG